MAAEEKPLQRDLWLDNVKGILMITVVVGHMISSPSAKSPDLRFLYELINAFHMGTFMILTGYLSKRRVDQKDYLCVFNKNAVPYVIAQLLMYVYIAVWENGFSAANSSFFTAQYFSFFIPIYQLWYLFAIIVYIPLSAAIQPRKRPWLFLLGALVLSLACGYFKQVTVFSLTKIASFYLFFLIGYLLPQGVMTTLRNKRLWMLAAAAVWGGFVFFMAHPAWRVGLAKTFGLSTAYEAVGLMAGGVPPVVGRLLYLLAVPIIALAFYALCPRGNTPFAKLGQRSMYIYVLHVLVVVAVRCLKVGDLLTTWWAKALYLAGAIAVAFLLATDPVKKLFRPMLEPNFDLAKTVRSLCERCDKKNGG